MTFQAGAHVWIDTSTGWISTSSGDRLDQVPASDCPPSWEPGLVLYDLERPSGAPSLYRVAFALREEAQIVAGERLASRHDETVPAVRPPPVAG